MYVVAWGSFMTMHKNTSKSMKRDTVLNAKAHQAPTENLPGVMYMGGWGGGWGLYKTWDLGTGSVAVVYIPQ